MLLNRTKSIIECNRKVLRLLRKYATANSNINVNIPQNADVVIIGLYSNWVFSFKYCVGH